MPLGRTMEIEGSTIEVLSCNVKTFRESPENGTVDSIDDLDYTLRYNNALDDSTGRFVVSLELTVMSKKSGDELALIETETAFLVHRGGEELPDELAEAAIWTAVSATGGLLMGLSSLSVLKTYPMPISVAPAIIANGRLKSWQTPGEA